MQSTLVCLYTEPGLTLHVNKDTDLFLQPGQQGPGREEDRGLWGFDGVCDLRLSSRPRKKTPHCSSCVAFRIEASKSF